MSWNNVLPWKFWECSGLCKGREPNTGYVIHEADCPIGKELKEEHERKKNSGGNTEGA